MTTGNTVRFLSGGDILATTTALRNTKEDALQLLAQTVRQITDIAHIDGEDIVLSYSDTEEIDGGGREQQRVAGKGLRTVSHAKGRQGMSFFSHIGLSVIDKLTDNAFDKLGNAIKKGDVSEILKQFKWILENVEDKLGDVTDLIDDALEDGKKAFRKEASQVKRRLIRETREDMENLSEQFGEKMADAMEEKIAGLVKAEVVRQLNPHGISGSGYVEAQEKA